jgi:hypothetical protein
MLGQLVEIEASMQLYWHLILWKFGFDHGMTEGPSYEVSHAV